MIDDVHIWVGASSAGLAAGLTWLGHLPGRRRAAQHVRQVHDRARQAAARSEQTAGQAAHEARSAVLREVEEVRAEAAANWSQLQLVMAELEHLVAVRLPAVAQRLQGVSIAAPTGLRRPEVFDGSEVAERMAEIEEALREAAAAVRRRVEDSARAGVRVAAEEIQAALTRAQRDIDNALDDQDDPELSARPDGAYTRTLARVDHSVTLAGHTVQRLRILTESWPGVQRANCTVAEIVESARGRVRQSEAVDYTYRAQTGETVVEGLVVEPVIVVLTELLDNATSYSGAPAATHVVRVAAGMRITVEDQGLGMSPLQLQEAERALASGETDVTGLGDPGRLGFLVIGRLVHAYGLRVGLSPSASGGVRADLLIPTGHLVADGPEETRYPPMAVEQEPSSAAAPYPAELPAGRTYAAEPAAVQGELPEDHQYTAELPAAEPYVSELPAARLPTAGTGGGTDIPTAVSPATSPSTTAGETPAAPELTAYGLPKRQPRRPARRDPAPRQEEVADAEAFTEGFARLRGVLAAEYDRSDSVNEGWST
ncbi:ATP-binding protein [Embleya sp. NPDC050154]|uniref:ATP-binding protein n=1 Tax=Embleya sp. NPDC050154 TaxID=3363988 RepID=UPI003791752B